MSDRPVAVSPEREVLVEKRSVLTCDECSRPAMTFDPARELVRIQPTAP